MSDNLRPHGLQCSRLPVLHNLPELAQSHAHWVGDAIQPSHPLSPPSPLALNLSQHHGLFEWVVSSHLVIKVVELQHQSFQWIFRLISFRINLFDLLAVQGTLKSLLQHNSSKTSFIRIIYFFKIKSSNLKSPWCWERVKAGGEGGDREWDGWTGSLTRGTWVWISSKSWWMDREAWHAAVHGVAKKWVWLSD